MVHSDKEIAKLHIQVGTLMQDLENAHETSARLHQQQRDAAWELHTAKREIENFKKDVLAAQEERDFSRESVIKAQQEITTLRQLPIKLVLGLIAGFPLVQTAINSALREGKKIKAMFALRDGIREETGATLGLKRAKETIEHIMKEQLQDPINSF